MFEVEAKELFMPVLIISCVMGTLLLVDAPEQTKGSTSESKIPFGGTDFKQYYTTSLLILQGHNPYDYERAGVIQRKLGSTGETQVPYGPPTSLLPFIPLGWLDFMTAIQVQFVVNVSMLVISCFLWGKMLFLEKSMMPLLSCIAVVAWIPCLSLFGMGHVTSWTLLGFTLWCFCMQQKQPVLAGCSLALSIIKPHLALGIVIYACCVSIWSRQWRMLSAFITTVLAMILATWFIRPTIWLEFFASLEQSNPTQWFNATLDGWGRYQLGQWFRVVTVGVGILLLGWIIILSRCRARTTDAEFRSRQDVLALTLWMAATPYAFSYDFILLLPAFILAIGAWFHRMHPHWLWGLAGWVLLDVIYVMKKGVWIEYQYFFIPWGGLALALLLHTASTAQATEKRGN